VFGQNSAGVEAGEQLLRMIDDLFDRTRIGLPRS